MLLSWHDYSYYPYERELATREVDALFDQPAIRETARGIELVEGNGGPVSRLTYFSAAVNGRTVTETLQSQLERAARAGRSRQATRYSVHGLHEYKGKFNPQVVKALLNIFGIRPGARVLDPFCGSGTTLVECAHAGILGCGADVNPFAVFLANAKLQALSTPVSDLVAARDLLLRALEGQRPSELRNGPRMEYLRSWFEPDVLGEIERIRVVAEDVTGRHSPVFLALASDLLRDYSMQDPQDLRIRRRKSRLPDRPVSDALSASSGRFLDSLEAAQGVLGMSLPRGIAQVRDTCTLAPDVGRYDAVITSPPYAMALPYVDTQRLSLVWLGLADPAEISRLDAELIGSREFRRTGRRAAMDSLRDNGARLPEPEAAFCLRLQGALTSHDGFRRQAVPALLYRYLASMRGCFSAVRGVVGPGAPFALVVGHNHTVLGGVRYDIDTPAHLASLADDAGWAVEELLPLQTYRRYGYHVRNAVRNETLVILRRP